MRLQMRVLHTRGEVRALVHHVRLGESRVDIADL